MKKIIRSIGLILLSILVLLVVLYNIFNPPNPLDNITIQDVFGRNVKCNLSSRRDLGGLDIHGDQFFLFDYDVSFLNDNLSGIEDSLRNYPKYASGFFKDMRLSDSCFAIKWRHLPLQGHLDSLVFHGTLTFASVEQYIDEKYYTDTDNFYSFVLCRPIGNLFMLLVPKKKKMYLVIHNVGG